VCVFVCLCWVWNSLDRISLSDFAAGVFVLVVCVCVCDVCFLCVFVLCFLCVCVVWFGVCLCVFAVCVGQFVTDL